MTSSSPADAPVEDRERPPDTVPVGLPAVGDQGDDGSAAAEAVPTDARPRAGWLRWPAGLVLVLAAALPALVALVDLLRGRGEPYLPLGDHALLELTVDDVGEHEVLLGAYSRFLWHHPGPLLAYVLSVPFRLLDGAHEALAVGAVAVAGISSMAVVALVARRGGLLAGAWALLVLTVSVRLLGDDFVRDSWNPHLPVLPLLAGVLLCWAVIRGSAWALPVAVLPMSLAVQAHVGFAPVVGAVAAVVVLGLGVRAAVRLWSGRTGRPRRPLWWLRWPVSFLAAALVALLLWLPPITEQLTGEPGNITLLLDYLREGSGEPAAFSSSEAVRLIAEEFAKLPAYVGGAVPPEQDLVEDGLWPTWAVVAGLGLFAAALAVAAFRRRGDVLWLGGLTLAVAAAGVVALTRIEGLPFVYITRWTVVVGILAWITVGLGLLPELVTGVRALAGRRGPALLPAAVVGAPLAVLAAVAVVGAGQGAARAQTPFTDTTGELSGLASAVVADLDRLGLRTVPDPPVVRVDMAGTTRQELVGTFWPGTGVVLHLHRDGVDVQVSDFWELQLGPRYTDRADDAGYVVTLAYADGSSPPPEPWQQILAVEGELQVYGGVPPTA
ncbi:hypothetical protein [Trujillonella endophytica]|uniref:4-amino-4-deoxy-L-arabinose transferase n=1 Tax=Trujillonella endophytica TaxID=673521 RepID=A0A1H8PR66_9ACTN|nr:hypothetical protein [Trujillella endophytica]SEO44266.1 hypothetical protein SAMN05660991_00321 [Trujillella endophytica]